MNIKLPMTFNAKSFVIRWISASLARSIRPFIPFCRSRSTIRTNRWVAKFSFDPYMKRRVTNLLSLPSWMVAVFHPYRISQANFSSGLIRINSSFPLMPGYMTFLKSFTKWVAFYKSAFVVTHISSKMKRSPFGGLSGTVKFPHLLRDHFIGIKNLLPTSTRIIFLFFILSTPCFAQFDSISPFPSNLIFRDDGTVVEGTGKILDLRSNLSVTYDSLTSTYHLSSTGSSSNGVTSDSVITDNVVVKGDGGARGIKGTGVTIGDDESITTTGGITADSLAVTKRITADSIIVGGRITTDSIYPNSILSIPHSNSLPGSCSSGFIYMDTNTTSGQRIYACENGGWILQGDGGGGGAPTDADYLVGTSNASLSAEIVVGTTPGGELGGTWGTPTLDDSVTVTGWVMGASTATTPSADDDDTSLATTAYVQTEINAMGGRSLSVTSGSMDADAELYTDTKCVIIETPADADNFLMYRVPVNSTVTTLNCIVEAATSAVILFQECDTAGDNCSNIDGITTITCDVDGQADDGSLSNAAIDATDWIRIDIGTVTGTVGHVTACLTMTKND